MPTFHKGMIMSALRSATSDIHDQTEQLPDAQRLAKGQIDKDVYLKILKKHLRFHYSYRQAMQRVKEVYSDSPLFRFPAPKCIEWLQADLGLDSEDTIFSHIDSPLNLSSPPNLAGAMYVTEGSMLGGRTILKFLQKCQPVQELQPFRFFNGYGKETGKRWKEFQLLLEEVIEDDNNLQQASESAVQTFKAYYNILSQD